MKSLLIFLPDKLVEGRSGYLFGKVLYDESTGAKKFYIIGVREFQGTDTDIIGYYTNAKDKQIHYEKSQPNWVHICNNDTASTKKTMNYSLKRVIVSGKEVTISRVHTVVLIYDQLALRETQLFESPASGNHFHELMKILQSESVKRELTKIGRITNIRKNVLMYFTLVYLYPVLFLSRIINKLSPILKYSSLGLHLDARLKSIKWMLNSIIEIKAFNLKTGNYACALIIDMILGIILQQLILSYVVYTSPSDILLSNAEKVVESLKNLIEWLMGVPAGLKLNCALNNMLGKFFLYHIDLWWTFLIVIKPIMNFAFEVLVLFGKLGITFQIAIAADLFSLVSFHTYCIYVYAARLFNIQLKGITALFRLFLGKKKNPLRERVDSCQYQPDQLFVGTLLFTILLFLMPTTWIYYTVFTMLRLASISFGGFLTRLKFYLEVMPIYTFLKWLLHTNVTCSTVNIQLHSQRIEGPIILVMTMAVASWGQTWNKCIPDTIIPHAPIEWGKIVNNIILGELLYPL